MKVLLISTYDTYGGAAIAASRLMDALIGEGVDARMLVRDKRSGNNRVTPLGSALGNKWNFAAERGGIYLHNRLSKRYLFDVSTATTGVSVTKLPAFAQADVIHLHWINQGMLSVREIGRILASGKKVVWTMHDMWPFTGICHHARDCRRYEAECGDCPYLQCRGRQDVSHRVFRRKTKAYASGDLAFAACSQWLAALAGKSPLTRGHTVLSIPNPIDTAAYSPENKAEIRQQWGLPHDKKIVLFAAVKTSDKRKGTDYLLEASRLLAQEYKEQLFFLIAGNDGGEIERQLPFPAKSTGFVPPHQMPGIYNAADVFITPSLQENLPNTLMESMACGTPCVGFRIGGIPEMIDHRQNGYVADYRNAADFAEGIRWVLFEADYAQLQQNARRKVLKEYDRPVVAQTYISLYQQLLEK